MRYCGQLLCVPSETLSLTTDALSVLDTIVCFWKIDKTVNTGSVLSYKKV